MSKYGDLILGMRDSDGSEWVDVENWLHHIGTSESFIAAGAVYWPEFVRYRDCIIRDSDPNNQAVNFDRLIAGGPVERGYVEERLNRLEIAGIVPSPETTPLSMKQALHLGRTLAQMWKAKLAVDFPDIEFYVSFIEHAEDTVSDLEVTFCQARTYKMG